MTHVFSFNWAKPVRQVNTKAWRQALKAGSASLQPPNEKGRRSSQALEILARPAGFEPTTPWFVALDLNNQVLVF